MLAQAQQSAAAGGARFEMELAAGPCAPQPPCSYAVHTSKCWLC